MLETLSSSSAPSRWRKCVQTEGGECCVRQSTGKYFCCVVKDENVIKNFPFKNVFRTWCLSFPSDNEMRYLFVAKIRAKNILLSISFNYLSIIIKKTAKAGEADLQNVSKFFGCGNISVVDNFYVNKKRHEEEQLIEFLKTLRNIICFLCRALKSALIKIIIE